MNAVHEANYRLAAASIKHGPFTSFRDSSVNTAALPKVQAIPDYFLVSITQHVSKRWQRVSNYQFAAKDAVIPVTAQEMPKIMMSMPLAFVASGHAFTPVVVQGITPNENLFVASDGRWVGIYIPAAYRSYPFVLANTEDGQQVLCIDQASGLITDGPQGEPFFNDDGTPTQTIRDVFNFLTEVHANRDATIRICAVLQKHQLIQPWTIKVQDEAGERNIEGLFRIDEAALNALLPEAFYEVHQAGALPVAYCQLLSMQNLSKLGELARARVLS